MRRKMMYSKIHRATVTHADLHYEGSVTIDTDLLEASGILPFEAVCIWNVTQGTRLETYALPGPAQSGVICVNGAAAHLNAPGDLVIICAFVEMEAEEALDHRGICVRVDEDNKVISKKEEIPGPQMPEQLAVAGS